MIVACAADRRFGMSADLERQVLEAGIEFLWEPIRPFSWAGMLEWELDVCRRSPHRTICFVDSNDFLFQGSREELEALASEQDVLFHSEATCWPEPHKADFFPTAPTGQRFLNGTGPFGRGDAIAALIEHGQAHYPIRGRESSIFADNDQRFWTDVFLGPKWVGQPSMGIDYYCQLSVSMNAIQKEEFEVLGGRLYIGSYSPQFVHFNGASKNTYASIVELLR